VAACDERGIDLADLTPPELAELVPELDGTQALLDARVAVARRDAVSGPAAVRRQLRQLRAAFQTTATASG
jgi:hypothetical protein